MNATTEPKPVLNHDLIATLAYQIWQTEGCQAGRDEEYWQRAEGQILAASPPRKALAKNGGTKQKTSSSTGKNSVRQPAVL